MNYLNLLDRAAQRGPDLLDALDRGRAERLKARARRLGRARLYVAGTRRASVTRDECFGD